MLKPTSNLFSVRTISGFIAILVILACSSLSTPIETATIVPTLPLADSSTPTPAPTQTPGSTLTPVPPPAQDFSLDNAGSIPPENILEEVSYSVVGGGGGPTECPYYDPSSPTIGLGKFISKNEGDQQTIEFSVCGWKFDEEVDVMITSPTGKVKKETIIATRPFFNQYTSTQENPFAVIDYEYLPEIGEYGRYEFAFSGSSGFFKNVVYVHSSELEMTYIQSASHQVLFLIQGLYSHEKVQFIIYRSVGQDEPEYNANEATFKFVASDDFVSDARGELIINLVNEPELSSDQYFKVAAVGEKSGPIHYYDGLAGVQRTDMNGACIPDPWIYPPQIPSRLEVGDYAFVSLNSSQSNRVRSGPGKDNNVTAVIRPGTVIKLVDGPKCINGANWWKVTGIDTKLNGWTLEGEGEYWLVPCSSKNKACP